VAVIAEKFVVMRQAGYFYLSVGIAALAHDIYDKLFNFLTRNFYLNVLYFDFLFFLNLYPVCILTNTSLS